VGGNEVEIVVVLVVTVLVISLVVELNDTVALEIWDVELWSPGQTNCVLVKVNVMMEFVYACQSLWALQTRAKAATAEK